MSAYVIFLETIHDHQRFHEYRKLVTKTLKPFGGAFVVRGGHFTVIEGDWPYERCVVIEFPSREQAEAWYQSSEYQEILPLRLGATQTNSIIIEGMMGGGSDTMGPISKGFLEELKRSRPHMLDLAAMREIGNPATTYVEVIIASPVDGPFKEGLWIQTANEEVTVGFGAHHQHFNEWHVSELGREGDPANIYEAALNFVDRILAEEIVQVTVERQGRYFASWLEPSDRIADILAGRVPWMEYGNMMGASLEIDREAPYTLKIKSWRGTINTEIEL